LWFTDKPPFHTVYLHGLVRDAEGRKFSKTIGNVIDPLVLVDQYGTDPLRFALITSGTPGNDVNLDEEWVENSRNFVNKIWQATSFIMHNLDADFTDLTLPAPETLDLPSRWILARRNKLVKSVQYLFDTYQYGEAGRQVRSFLWEEFAPWYIEISKHPLYNGNEKEKEKTLKVLIYTLDTVLRLLHPFMPFVTEELWGYLPHKGEALIIADWPTVDEAYLDEKVEAQMIVLIDLVRQVRDIRNNQYNINPGKKLQALVAPGSHGKNIADYAYVFSRLCNVEQLELLSEGAPAPEQAASGVVNDATIYLPLADMIDFEAECTKLQKERDNLRGMIQQTEGKLANENFVNRAPENVVQRERDRLTDLNASLTQIDERIGELCN